jgi:uncharacterized iron-regulated protein
MMKLIIILFLITFTGLTHARSFTLLDLKEGDVVTPKDITPLINDDSIIILGEYHYQKEIIAGQAYIIEELSSHKNAGHKMAVAWEFLNYPEQAKLNQSFSEFTQSKITFSEFLESFFPTKDGKENENYFYRPLFENVKKFNGKFIATNAPRSWKRVVVSSGIEALPAEQVPTYMRRGGDQYFERFFDAMGGHGDATVIEGYFMAQSYTDAVMADSLIRETNGFLTFMTVGSFHSDYGHGLPSYLQDLSSRQIINIKIISKAMTSVDEINLLKKEDLRYGYVADYLLIVD